MSKYLQPLTRRTAESLAVEALRSHVLSGATDPGERLTETALADRLHVSRATVRTALHQLTQKARDANIDLHQSLSRHDVSPALRRLGDAVITGATGTNVNDLKLVLIE